MRTSNRNNDYERYLELCDLIECAVEEAKVSEEIYSPEEILIAVSPDCQTVMCTLTGRWEDADYTPQDTWSIYSGLDTEDLCEQVQDSFDFRN
jgi:hypothetical protein